MNDELKSGAHYRLERVEEVDLDARVAVVADGEEGSQG